MRSVLASPSCSTTIEHNAAIAGAGAGGLSGGMDASNLFGKGPNATVSNCTIDHNAALGGPGGTGGNGWGGGLADLLGASLTLNDSTVEHNLAIGGDGGSGGNGGDGLGGGMPTRR